MASKGKKDKGGGAAAVPEAPPEREVVPGKVTESQWREWLEGEESVEVAGEVVNGLVDLAFSLGQEHYLEEKAFSYTVETARLSLLQIIEWEFLQRDEGERDPGNDPSWLEDDEPECSVIDSWARGTVPETTNTSQSTPSSPNPPLDQDLHNPEVPLSYERENSATNTIPPKENSRQPTRATSTVGSSSTFTSAATTSRPARPAPPKKVARLRPQVRRPQARLQALAGPRSEEPSSSPPAPPEHTEHLQAPSPAHSHTPSSTPLPPSPSHPLPPPLLPYNMKPAQLRWQKDVTYDSSGRIVDMLRLDPASFPSHRVKPRVTVSGVSPATSHRHTHTTHHHSSPLSHPHKPTAPGKHTKTREMREGGGGGVRGGGVRSEGVRSEGVRSEGVRRREDGSVAGSRAARERGSRFPEILTLPALVDTIDPSAGVCVREGGRSVCGPPSPHRPPHFLLPHTNMLPLSLPPTLSTSSTTGNIG